MKKKKKKSSSLIIIIFRYSLIKIKENGLPPNSVLKPDTSSDSLSEKSKGVRCISLKIFGKKIIRSDKVNKVKFLYSKKLLIFIL